MAIVSGLVTAAAGDDDTVEAVTPATGLAQQAVDTIWRPAPSGREPARPASTGVRFGALLDTSRLDDILAETTGVDGSRAVLPLPMPDGSFVRFHLEAVTLPPERAPAVRAFRGRSLSGDLSARIEWTSAGLHAVVSGLDDAVFVDPDPSAGPGVHVAYHARDAARPLVAGGELPLAAVRRIEGAMAEKARRTPAQRKIGSVLLDAVRDPTVPLGLDVDDAGRVLVDITADVSQALLDRINVLGGSVVDSVERYRAVRARLPSEALEALAAEDAVSRIEPADIAATNAEGTGPRHLEIHQSSGGSLRWPEAASTGRYVPGGDAANGDDAGVPGDSDAARSEDDGSAKENTSEGDAAHAAAAARERFGVDGTGIGIGVLSNGVETLADRQATGDLPPHVTVLSGQAGDHGDEGTAMLEIVHDLAPGAHLYFATAFGGEARFAANIEALCEAGADVVVDDVFYFTEGVFQDGTVARAINRAVADGCFHFSPAGNSGRLDADTAGVWEGDFAAADGDAPPGVEGTVHDFGGTNSNAIAKLGLALQLKWADPLGASANDYDLYLFDETLTELLAKSTDTQEGASDPYERVVASAAEVGSRLVVVKATGEDRYLRLNTIRGRLEHATDGQISGHSGAKSAITAAAVDARTAGGADGAFDGSESVEAFSSDGPRRMFYEPDGTPVTPGSFGADGGERVAKPDIAAADGVTTATPGFRDFHGTSAAAPHAAAIAALALQAAGGPGNVSLEDLRDALAAEALDIESDGADRNAGAGIIVAPAAVEVLDSPDEHHAPTVAMQIGDRTLLGLDSATFDLSAHFEDADRDEVVYSALTGDAEIVKTGVEGSMLTLTPAGRGAATVIVRATDTGGLSVLEIFAVTVDREWGETDYDADDDGLIEIATLEQLDAVRLDLDGDGVEDALANQERYFEAFPDAIRDMGCATGCTGYELTRDLDFDDPASYASGRADRGWRRSEGGAGWTPIVSSRDDYHGLVRIEDCFAGDFDGNGLAIANLYIDRRDQDNVGLFGGFGWEPGDYQTRRIQRLSMVDVDVAGQRYVGGLAGGLRACCGTNHVEAVRVTGRVAGRSYVGGVAGFSESDVVLSHASAEVSGRHNVGGLVGEGSLFATIGASYATGTVRGQSKVGGLAGWFDGTIIASYATGRVAGVDDVGGLTGYGPDRLEVWASFSTARVTGERRVGGLFGHLRHAAPVYASYWDVETSGTEVGVGSDDLDGNGRVDGDEARSRGVTGKTTAGLTGPRGYRAIFANWRVAAKKDANGYYPGEYHSPLGDGSTSEDYDPWDFGTAEQYPALKADHGADGVRTWEEFGRQLREPPHLEVSDSNGVARLAWSESEAHWPAPRGIRYNIYRNDELLLADVAGTDYEDRPPSPGGTTAARYGYQIAAEVDGGEPVRSALVAVVNQQPAAPRVAHRAARVGESFSYGFPPSGDPDGHAVAYGASGMPGWLAFDAATRTFSGTPGEADAAATDVRVTATDNGTPPLSATAAFTLTVNPSSDDNRAPTVEGALAGLSLNTGEQETVVVAPAFADPDGDALSYAASVKDMDVALADPSVVGLLVEAVGAGATTVTVTASDGELTAELDFEVEVVNAAPRPGETIGARTLVLSGTPWRFDATPHFDDPDGDDLSYAAQSSDPDVVSVEVGGSTVTATAVGGGAATVSVSATDDEGSGETATQGVAVAVRVDYDHDDDGLIEVADLAQLDAIRFDPDGDATVGSSGTPNIPTSAIADAYDAAYPDRLLGMGCPGGCIGYELTADVDFDTNGSGTADAEDRFWNDGLGWDPIGGGSFLLGQGLFGRYTKDNFHAVFEGNGHAISNLFIDRVESVVGTLASFNVGLFATVERGGTVRNVRLLGANVAATENIGPIAGSTAGSVVGVVTTGTIEGRWDIGGVVGNLSRPGDAGGSIRNARAHVDVTGEAFVGGLVARNAGRIVASYATGDVAGESYVGGLAALSGRPISASYATGTITGDSNVGGLIGLSTEDGRIVASYATGAVVAQKHGGGVVGQMVRGLGAEVVGSYSERHAAEAVAVGFPGLSAGSRTTADLLNPSGYDGIYRDWNIDLDGDGVPDDPWSFEAGRYPALKFDNDSDGEATGAQRGPTGIAMGTSDTDAEGIMVTWDAPLHAGDEITRYELQRRVGDGAFTDVDPAHAGAETSYADAAPEEGTAHTYRVRAVTPAGATQWSPPASTAPGAPQLEVEVVSGGATLAWSVPADTGTSPVSGYQYQQTADGGNTWDPAWIDIPDSDAETRAFEAGGLTAGLRYGFEVRAVNASGPGAGSARSTIIVGTPGPPRDLSATPGERQVTLRWSPPQNPGEAAITGYQLRQSADGGGTWAPDWTDLPKASVESHVVLGLANATRYTFEVRAVNTHGPGAAARVGARMPPALAETIPDLEFPALGDEESVPVSRYFAVVPGGTLTYTAVSADPDLVSVGVDGDVLVVSPNDLGEDGETTVTLTAVDDAGRVVETTFTVTVDPLPGWWRRWGAHVAAALGADEPPDR
ncbi:MAG: fibronectin type III domain-containing protein [Gammaproteobacteria bacterium]|nr:fibronectin type III domain-containing protein [Gammaproteobacteria bacterium]